MKPEHFMENNLLFDLLDNNEIIDWEKEELEGELASDIEKIKKIKSEFDNSLNEDGKKKLHDLLFEIDWLAGFFIHRINMKVFYYAIGFGMKLQRNLDEFILDKM